MVRMHLHLAAHAAAPTGTDCGLVACLRVAATGRLGVGPLCVAFYGRVRLGGASSRARMSATLWAGPARLARVRFAPAIRARFSLSEVGPVRPAPGRPGERASHRPTPGGTLARPLALARAMLSELLPRLSWQRLDVSLLLGAGDAMATALGTAALDACVAGAVARLVRGARVHGGVRLNVWPDFRSTALAARVDVAAAIRPIQLAAAALRGLRRLQRASAHRAFP